MGNQLAGARDIHTFRKRLDGDSLPDVSDVTYEGLFNEYFFDTLTNIKNDDEKEYSLQEQLMIPTYCFAKSKVPKPMQMARRLASEQASTEDSEWEYYMNVGLNENFDVNNMKRHPLNLTIVLDNSGSMSSSFDNKSKLSKMEVANKAVLSLLTHLTDKDRLCVISFNSSFTIVQQMQLIKEIDMEALKANVIAIKAGGGTNMESAYAAATSCYRSMFDHMKVNKEIKTATGSTEGAAAEDAADTAEAAEQVDGVYPTPQSADEVAVRKAWKEQSECSVYSDSEKQWFDATIVKITNDKEGEWLAVAYRTGCDQKTPTLKQVQRFAKEIRARPEEYFNRVIFLTDAQPNARGGGSSLLQMVKDNSSLDQFKGYQIHTTFIGVGLDFNTQFIEKIIKVPGGNYYAVHSNEQFMKTMDEEFKFMVTPIVFEFVMRLMAEGNSCCIEESFGSGDDEKALGEDGEVMNVQSMFPSQHDENDQVKGGVVVLKLKDAVNGKADASYHMQIRATYKDIDGKHYKLENNVLFGGGEENMSLKKDEEYFDNMGIRKAILLVRYVQLLKMWMTYQKKQENKNKLPAEYREIMDLFLEHFEAERAIIGDDQLKEELKILKQITKKN